MITWHIIGAAGLFYSANRQYGICPGYPSAERCLVLFCNGGIGAGEENTGVLVGLSAAGTIPTKKGRRFCRYGLSMEGLL